MPTRRNVFDLDPNGPAIASLRQGIATMKSRPPSNPTSWRFQANIHGTFDTPAQPTWNRCQHGSFFFLSWHRMYLYFFERILRAASGDQNLALPYWRWTVQRRLPIAFRQPADASNPLFEPRRAPGMNAGTQQLPLSAVQTGQAMSFTNFSSPPGSGLSFGGQRVTQPVHLTRPHGSLEGSPHDVIHGAVGGSGPAAQHWMSFPQTAARDPIFWLHHAMIDRLWKRWLDQGGGRQNPVGNSAWMDTQFTFFNENGQQVTMRGQDILDTVNQLDYRYDDDPALSGIRVPFAAAEVEVAASAHSDGGDDGGIDRTLLGESVGEDMIELGATPKTVPIEMRDEARDRVAALAQAKAVPVEERVVLNVEGVQFDDQHPGVFYEVYLNLPEGQQPHFQSDYYVGNIGFFGVGTHEAGGHGGHPADQSFDVTDIVRVLRERGEWNEGEASVSFVMRGLEPTAEEAESREAYAEQEEPPGRPRIERVTITTGG
jgi:Common central domain of tyrosinase/Polyphenol oxidase middle domain